MHKKQRGSFNKKYLIFSIIGVIIFAVLLSFFTLKPTNKPISQPKTTNSTPTISKYTTIKKNLDQRFNQNGKVVTIKQENNINDSTSKQPHSVIVVKLIDKQTQKYLKASYEAVQNNQASDDQKNYVHSIQKIISDQAKKLNNNYDVIQFVYQDGKKFIPVASSQKTRDIIKVVKTK
ncbi:hypothetical protein [Companilactobacillus nuruki]|uniref:Uncharacterized protein n=1 Tax=Companilactobacillus nuruki TaxID=1993540 RepID=A0A2N7ATF4_9LACO|nr:hypothetical protein [Companilactobacillus nuruki]PMD69467.1 hypothetical protein CBP76_08075 [Companilactobacillus nuruki]